MSKSTWSWVATFLLGGIAPVFTGWAITYLWGLFLAPHYPTPPLEVCVGILFLLADLAMVLYGPISDPPRPMEVVLLRTLTRLAATGILVVTGTIVAAVLSWR